MDHLPYPSDSPRRPVRVPLLIPSSEIIDCTSSTIAETAFGKAWTPRSTHGQRLSRSTAAATIAGVQRWLYFGLLSRFLDRPLAVVKFSSGSGFIDTSSLPEQLEANRSQIQSALGHESVLRHVEREVRKFSRITYHNEELLEQAQIVILSIRVLSDSLWRTLRNSPEYAADEFMRHNENYTNVFSSPGLEFHILRRRMRIEDGWCRAMVSYILGNLTASTAYYLSSVRRVRGIGAPLHRDCTDTECRLNVDESRYQQQHSSSCDRVDCRMVQAPLEKVLNIIEEGGIPLMRLVDDELEVCKAEYNLKYTAVTHVWSGGLGNPDANAIWLCQLREISTLPQLSQEEVESYNAPRDPSHTFPMLWDMAMDPSKLRPRSTIDWFWIDTLCIPRTANKIDKAHQDMVWARRQDAINRMTQTYAAATSVIVLDPELRGFTLQKSHDDSTGDDTIVSLLAKVFCSGWMTRCWTLQEAAMASELLVQTFDQPFVLSIARAKIMERNKELLQDCSYNQIHDIMDELSVWFSRLPGTRNESKFKTRETISQSSPEVFTRIWNDLAVRSTSRPIDRLQIFSLLVDLAPGDLLNIHSNDRLKAILKAQSSLPLALLFQKPLSSAQAREVEEQRKNEERADRDRGTAREPLPQDRTYPLPTRIRSEPLPNQLGWMKRKMDGNYIYFNTSLLCAGRIQPSLFNLGSIRLGRSLTYTIYDQTSNLHLSMSFGSVRDLELVLSHDHLYLLLSCDLLSGDGTTNAFSEFPGVLLRESSAEGSSASHTRRRSGKIAPWRFQRACSVLCTTLEENIRGDYTTVFKADLVPWDKGTEYMIECDFSKVGDLTHHQIEGFSSPILTTFRISATMTPLLLLYYLIFLALTAPAAFTHGPATFSPGYFAIIALFFTLRILAFVWNSIGWTGKAHDIMFNEWVNGLHSKDGTPPTFDRRRHHTGFYIHMTRGYSIAFGGICILFIILGGALFRRRNARWLVPLGVAGVLELILRYLAEIFYTRSRFLQTIFSPTTENGQPEYEGLYQNFFAESWVTRKFKGLFSR